MTLPPTTWSSPPAPLVDPRLRGLPLASALCFTASLAANGWLALALLRGEQSASPWLRWPHDWHAWLLQCSALLLALLMLGLNHSRVALLRWWDHAGAQHRALALCTPLLGLEVFFGAGFWLTKDSGVAQLGYLRAFFWLDAEHRPATWFSALQLWLVAFAAWGCHRAWRAGGSPKLAYAIAAGLCLYLGADEGLGLHEAVGRSLSSNAGAGASDGRTFAVGPVRAYGWTLVYAPLALLVGGLLARRFRRELPRDGSFGLLVLASLVYVGGAVGVETLNSHGIANGWHTAKGSTAQLHVLVEEMMEMAAVTLAFFVFMRCRLALPRAAR